MSTKKKSAGGSKIPSKKTPDEMAQAIHSKDADIRDAVHAVLKKAGLHGVTVHSVSFSVDPGSMTTSGCFPDCDPTTEKCVSVGGSWQCVPL
jgi:hypothetical protein